jgi:glycine betaine/proline transport system substrate-binding protein
MINQIMTAMHTQKGLSPRDAGLIWLKHHPDTYQGWLKNVTTTGGKPAAPVFAAALEKISE